MDLIILLILLVTSVTALGRRGLDRNSMRSFSLFFLAGYTAFAVSHLDFYLIHSGFSKYYDPMILLLINLCPLLWLRFFFEKDNRSASTSDVEETLARFCGKFGISKRERDIIEQVMLGKSNKGIEKVLFISHNTVKNHIYNIFRKTGVGSRSELIHRINRFQD